MYKRDAMPYYGGPVSFFRSPQVEFDEIVEGAAVVSGGAHRQRDILRKALELGSVPGPFERHPCTIEQAMTFHRKTREWMWILRLEPNSRTCP